MALIKCPECGKDVSDTCDSCIHCGFKLSKPKFETNSFNQNDDAYTEVIVNRATNIKSVKPLVWGIVLTVIFTCTVLPVITSLNTLSNR